MSNPFVFLWSIENFPMCARSTIDSPVFCVASLNNTKWRLQLMSSEYLTKKIECNLFLVKEEKEPENMFFDVSLAIISNQNTRKKVDTLTSQALKNTDCILFSSCSLSPDEFSSKKDIYLPNDTLTLQCTMRIYMTPIVSDASSKNVVSNTMDPKMFSNFMVHEETTSVSSEKSTMNKVCNPNKCCVRTRVEIFQKSVTLKIEEVSKRHLERKYALYVSSAFKDICPLLIIAYWRWVPGTSGSLHIEIQRKVPDTSKVMLVKCKMSIIVALPLEVLSEAHHYFRAPNDVWHLPKLMENPIDYKLYLQNDALTVAFDFLISHESFISHTESTAMEQNKIFKNEMLQLYINKHFCDATLQTIDRTFDVDKNILSARSILFRNMFENEENNCVNMNDVDSYILEKMLTYIYSDQLEDIDMEDAIKLYAAASKYEVLSLKTRCRAILESYLAVSNVWRILLLADTFADEGLLKAVKYFIFFSANDALDSNEWVNFSESHPILASKVKTEVLKELESYNKLHFIPINVDNAT